MKDYVWEESCSEVRKLQTNSIEWTWRLTIPKDLPSKINPNWTGPNITIDPYDITFIENLTLYFNQTAMLIFESSVRPRYKPPWLSR